eukprot:s2305_g1.t1
MHQLGRLEQQRLRHSVVAFNAAISACRMAAQWISALSLLNHMEQLELERDVVSYTAAMTVFEVAGLWQLALSQLEDLQLQKVEANVVTYNSAISACEKSEEWQSALQLLELLLQQRLATTISFNATISASGKAANWRLALHLLRKLEKDPSLKPSAISFNAAIGAACSASRWQKAVRFLSSAETSAVSYQELMAVAPWPLALRLLEEMDAQALPRSATTYEVLILLLSEAASWRMALQLLEEAAMKNFLSSVMLKYCLGACERASVWRPAAMLLSAVPEMAGMLQKRLESWTLHDTSQHQACGHFLPVGNPCCNMLCNSWHAVLDEAIVVWGVRPSCSAHLTFIVMQLRSWLVGALTFFFLSGALQGCRGGDDDHDDDHDAHGDHDGHTHTDTTTMTMTMTDTTTVTTV